MQRVRIEWESESNKIYSVEFSADLKKWETINEVPIRGTSPTQFYDVDLVNRASFFRVVTHAPTTNWIPQPPRVTGLTPDDLAVGVSRNSSIIINASDPFFINKSSIKLTVGNLGEFTLDNPELLFTNKIIFNPYNTIVLGRYGEEIPISLTLANSSGSITKSWSMTLVPLSVTSYFSTFQYIPHRGLPLLYAEETLDAYRATVAAGEVAIEADCHILKDGNIGIMHDLTVDRTTTGAGAVNLYDTASWKNLTVDAASFLGGGAGNSAPPLLDELLEEFGNKYILILEAKSSGTGLGIVSKLKKYNIQPSMAIVNSFGPSELVAARAAGYPTILNLSSYTGNPSPQQISALGNFGVCVPYTTQSSYMDALRAVGLKVFAYTAQTHAAYNLVREHCDGMYSDDTFYMRGDWRIDRDPFMTQTWYPGMFSNESSSDSRGAFYPPNKWGVDASEKNIWKGILQGWACPLGGGSASVGVIDYSVTFEKAYAEDETRFAWVAVMNSDEPFTADVPAKGRMGYTFLTRKNGTLEIYKYYYDGMSWAYKSMGTKSSKLIPNDATAHFRVYINETHIELARIDVPASLIIKDNNVRGVYLHSGAKGMLAKFSSMSVNF